MITTAVISYMAGVLFSAGLYTMHPKYARIRREMLTVKDIMGMSLIAGIGYGLIIFIITIIAR
jgi:hypothetical protein